MSDDTFEINGWTIYAHPLFLDQLEAMIQAVEKARKKDPKGYKKKRAAKLLAAVLKVEDIPSDPTPTGRHARRRIQTLVPGKILAAVPPVLSLSAIRGRQGHRARLGTTTRPCAPMRAQTTPTSSFEKCSSAVIRLILGKSSLRLRRKSRPSGDCRDQR